MKILSLFLFIALGWELAAQDAPPFTPQARPDRERPGPWDNDVLVLIRQLGGRKERKMAKERKF